MIRKKNERNNPIYHHIKRNKYLGTNLPEETKEPYSEHYKMLIKEIKNDTNRWNDTLYSCTERINIVKILI